MISLSLRLCALSMVLAAPVPAQQLPGQVDPVRVPMPDHHYLPEYTFDESTQPERWLEGSGGLSVAFGSPDELYLRSEVPPLGEMRTSWRDSGWRGERLNAQILVWSADSLSQVRLQVGDLVSPEGHRLDPASVQLHLVRYVLSNYPYGATDASCGVAVSDTAYLMPDRLETFDRFDLPGRSVRPVWLTIDIPRSAAPGTYDGTIEIRSENHQQTLALSVRVEPPVLREPRDWQFRLDLWQNPWVVADRFRVEPWGEQHRMLLKEHLKPYAESGGTFITTYAVHSPWTDNSYAVEGAMIESIREPDASWSFDYHVFDTYVTLAMEEGIEEAITVYTPTPWAHRFRYLDAATGNYVYEQWSPESTEYEKYWNAFLDDLQRHLEVQGWFEKTYLGINENPLDVTLAAIDVIKRHGAEWKITYAGDWHPELDALVDDYSAIISSEPTLAELQSRRSRGATTTFYVCCTPPQPNNFVFSDPIEGRYLGWYTAAMGYDGFLRWAYDAWPEDPDRDARHTLWPAGDTHLVYPGGASSIRMEKLREGIVDFEKLSTLWAREAALPEGRAQDLLGALRTHLASLVPEGEHASRVYDPVEMEASVHRGRELMSAISELMGD